MSTDAELRLWITVVRERLRRLPAPEVEALNGQFASAWFTAADVIAAPGLAAAIGARTLGSGISVGKRLAALRAAGVKGGLVVEGGKRARNAGLRWRVHEVGAAE